ncbi:LOW QUALITY PROTEIN: uncharacterized protein LOC115671092 [Syzygium oleosum]|uniref:LOW QUALITY PROTEIN: uncharacterized protein LOC115671092 n=1 Tax=Syzygium oleosum TaxID=219896 RepID=UPI0024B8E63C|nr:LOW QUALITY PROTEIN: uncharacterized protein LOC115671092 [Syzygium oleosum]
MKGTSQVIMGATLVMAGSLAIVLGLVLVLLAELYCSLLLRRRRLQKTAATSNAPVSAPPTAASPFRSPAARFSSQQLLRAGRPRCPRSLLFPAVSPDPSRAEPKPSPRQIGLAAASSPNFASVSMAQHVQNFPAQGSYNCGITSEHLVYISNPIYDNDVNCPNRQVNTPFETPDSSPSRLEAGASSSDDDSRDIEEAEPSSATPPLTPMKKLPAQACSVSLRDAGSLCTSGSDSHSHSNNGLSFSSTGTPSTSPSW